MITICNQCGGLRADPGEMFGGRPCKCPLPPAPCLVKYVPFTILIPEGHELIDRIKMQEWLKRLNTAVRELYAAKAASDGGGIPISPNNSTTGIR